MPGGTHRFPGGLAWAVLGLAAVVFGFAGVASGAPPAAAQEDEPAEADGAFLATGAAVFSRACTSCHQVGGVGIAGQYPPLRGNSRARDAGYVEQVIREGKQGPLEVNGVNYNGSMPVVAGALTDDEIAAVAAYVAADLTLPEGTGEVAAPAPAMPGPPAFARALLAIGFLLAAAAGAAALGPVVLASTDRVHLSWVDAALKTVIVVGYFVVATVVVPGEVLAAEPVASMSADAQALVGSAVWGGALAVGLVGLWWAHRRNLV